MSDERLNEEPAYNSVTILYESAGIDDYAAMSGASLPEVREPRSSTLLSLKNVDTLREYLCLFRRALAAAGFSATQRYRLHIRSVEEAEAAAIEDDEI
jgi:hypothetical protein